MSNRYKGGIISATPPTTTGGESGTASGAWTLEQQMQAQAAGLWPIQPLPNYIEDVFSTWLYTGNGSTQTINNGIDLAGEGGLVWTKRRSTADWHALFDTNRTINKALYTNTTGAETTESNSITSYNANGYSFASGPALNSNGNTFVSWTFRKQPKFFDVVTYTGDGIAGRTVAHNLGSVPGAMIIKCTSTTGSWWVYHRTLTATSYLFLNTTSAEGISIGAFNNTEPTDLTFTLGDNTNINGAGKTFVAYLFAHNAGGFGLTGTDNVISCGSYTGTGSALSVTLGYEPQWILVKRTTGGANNWVLMDTMRGMSLTQASWLYPNLSDAEVDAGTQCNPTATGFTITSTGTNLNAGGDTYIYIAIRRGPMKTPTTGTSVFSPNAYTGTGAVLPITGMGFPPDFLLTKQRAGGNDWCVQDKLRGPSQFLSTDTTGAELNLGTAQLVSIDQNGVTYGNGSSFVNFNGATYINLSFRRAPGFFDEVCYTGTSDSVGKTVNHNLAAVPELMIVKSRSVANSWVVYAAPLGNTSGLILNGTQAVLTGRSDFWNSTTPTSTVFSIGSTLNANTVTWVAYLFASAPGVSKVGSYTGTGTTQTIDCGFTAGSRFVLIKRTDSTGDWYVWDSARGIVAGDDPYLLLNSTAAEVTNTDYIDTTSVGFEISSTAPAAINASGGTFIFLAIA